MQVHFTLASAGVYIILQQHSLCCVHVWSSLEELASVLQYALQTPSKTKSESLPVGFVD